MDGFAPVLDRPQLEPPHVAEGAGKTYPRTGWRLRDGWRRLGAWGPFLLAVILPTLLVAAYYGLVAANQYESEAHFIVRTGGASSGAPSALGTLLGLGEASGGQSEARSVEDYLTSHDAVAALQRTLDLVALFRRPEADPLSRMGGGAHPAPETLLKYYRKHVKVVMQSDSGIASLTVRAFRPQDARQVAETLLALGEARVNTFNQRALDDSLSVARTQLREAEAAVAAAQGSVTSFRQSAADIDPDRSSTAQIQLSTGLQEKLDESRAQLASMSASLAPDSPQRVALAAQVRALQAQVSGVQTHLAGPHGAMAPGLGAYESLRLRQEFAAKRYEAAAAALEGARTEALRQQLFVIRVVEPNLPVKSLYPERLKIVTTLFFVLLVAYAIGWLILAGVREHAA